ncbi:hypothetical protein CBR_g78819 [Chara braunii]|uniref:Kinesin motor domain-containing protein n=1 Tax=Chara braunii TaxID=69332 RepID=A0A388KAF0_CHABU|nr:hypothetical protein CBR_g78819 [Chara braunii]|eukprot:GBG67038.1 hypothetical protein CBR_g78819 [Chara braunii]
MAGVVAPMQVWSDQDEGDEWEKSPRGDEDGVVLLPDLREEEEEPPRNSSPAVRLEDSGQDDASADAVVTELSFRGTDGDGELTIGGDSGRLSLSPVVMDLCRHVQEKVMSAREECQDLRQEASDLLEYSNAKINRVTRYLGVLADKARKLDMVVSETESRIAPLKRERKRLFNDLLSIKGPLRVYVRSRPPFDKEGPMSMATTFPDDYTIRVAQSSPGGAVSSPKKDFEYDRVFGPHISQSELFSEAQQFVQSAFDGYNVCILAYGQTGAGKTYTMEGTSQNRGVYYRSFQELLLLANQNTTPTSRYQFFVTMIEIYNEQIRDLLGTKPGAASSASARRRDFRLPEDGGVVCSVLEEEVVSANDFVNVLRQGNRSRSSGTPRSSDRQNRSHLIVTVHVEYHDSRAGERQYSKLSMVDMAGSERSRSDASGDRLTESLHINKSISTLGDVLSCLTTKKTAPPFRGSKLTSMLADSLGGDSKTLILVNVSPSFNDVQETLSSLSFGARVKNVELGLGSKDTIKKFRDMANESRKELYEREKQAGELQSEVLMLKQGLKESDGQCYLLFSELQKAWAVSTRLQTEVDSREMEIFRLEAENKLTEDRKRKGEEQIRSESAKLRLDMEEEKRRLIAEKDAEKRKALSEKDAEKRKELSEKDAEKRKALAEKDAAIESLQMKLQRMEKDLVKATEAAKRAAEHLAEQARQQVSAEEKQRQIEELAQRKALEMARPDKEALETAQKECNRLKEEREQIAAELKSECARLQEDLQKRDQLIEQLREEKEQLEQQKERISVSSSGPLKDIEFEGPLAVGDAARMKVLDKHAPAAGSPQKEQDRRSFTPTPISVADGGARRLDGRTLGGTMTSGMQPPGPQTAAVSLTKAASSLGVNNRRLGDAEIKKQEAASLESAPTTPASLEESLPVHGVVFDMPAVKTTPAGEFLTRSLQEFDPSNIETIAEISEGANKLLMLVLAAVMKAGTPREHEMLAEIRPAVFQFLRRMERLNVMDTMLVSHVRMLYIRALLGRSPELSGIQVPSVECFLERGGLASRRATPKTSPSPSPNPSQRSSFDHIRGFRVDLRQAKNSGFGRLLRLLKNVDPDTWRQHALEGRMKDINDEARKFAVGNISLAKLFAHMQQIDIQHKIRDWLAENYDFLTHEPVSDGSAVNQLDLFRTAIFDGWMTGLGVPQTPNTDALGQLLLDYTKKVYEAHLEQLKDLANVTAQEEAEDLAHMHKLMMNLEAMNTQRRKALHQMKSDIALLSYEENGVQLKVDSGVSHDDRIQSLRTLSAIAKQSEDLRKEAAKGPGRNKSMLMQLEDMEQRASRLMPVDREVARRYLREARKEVEKDGWKRFAMPENVSGGEESSGELSLNSAQWMPPEGSAETVTSQARNKSITVDGGNMTWSTIKFNNKQSTVVVKCSLSGGTDLVVKVQQGLLPGTGHGPGVNQRVSEGVELAEQPAIMPVPWKLVGLNVDQIETVLARLPEGLRQLVIPRVKTSEGMRARYTRLYETLAAKVGSAVTGGSAGELDRLGRRVVPGAAGGTMAGSARNPALDSLQRGQSFPNASARRRPVMTVGIPESRTLHEHGEGALATT